MTESICLVLKTFDINASDVQTNYYNTIVTTDKGKIFNSRTGYTWNNVNLKNLLGDEWYNKYDKFNICLVSLTQSYLANQPIAACNVVSVKMSGLQWLSSYDQSTGNDTGSVVVGVRNFNQNDDLSNTNYITFRKGQQITNITINLDCLQNDNTLVPNVQSTFGHMIFLFTISPVKD